MDKRFIKDNRGMTMTEVLLAFAILSIIMGLLSGIISFSKRIYVDATDQRRAQEVLQKYVYTKAFDTAYKSDSVVSTQYLPVYRVDPREDSEGNETGIYDIALVKQSKTGGKTIYSANNKGFPNKASCSGERNYENIDAVTIGKYYAQVDVSAWITDPEDSAMLGDLKNMHFVVFNKDDASSTP